MNSHKWIACLGMLAALVMTGCKSQKTNSTISGSATTPIAIQSQVHGDDAGLPGPDVLVINSKEQLAALGSAELVDHVGDFSEVSLVVMTLGEKSTGGHWAHITGVQREGNDLYVQGTAGEPGADAIVTQTLTHPYAAALISKVDDGVVVHPEIQTVASEEMPQ